MLKKQFGVRGPVLSESVGVLSNRSESVAILSEFVLLSESLGPRQTAKFDLNLSESYRSSSESVGVLSNPSESVAVLPESA